MEENKVTPYTETADGGKDTTPCAETSKEGSAVFVKFNKEIKEIPLDEAAVLAQKGLKFDMISDDFERLKTLARSSGKSIGEFLGEIEKTRAESRRAGLLEQTKGNSELTDYIMSLEEKSQAKNDGFNEVKAMFPEIKQIGELPEEVLENSRLSGKNLLDCYLRYLASKKLHREKEKAGIAMANRAGVGSLGSGCLPGESAANLEFLKGLWGK